MSSEICSLPDGLQVRSLIRSHTILGFLPSRVPFDCSFHARLTLVEDVMITDDDDAGCHQSQCASLFYSTQQRTCFGSQNEKEHKYGRLAEAFHVDEEIQNPEL